MLAPHTQALPPATTTTQDWVWQPRLARHAPACCRNSTCGVCAACRGRLRAGAHAHGWAGLLPQRWAGSV